MTQVFRDLFEAIVLALLIFFLIRGSIENFKVEGSSMKPELSGGEYVMVNKLSFFRVDMGRLSDLVPFWDAEAGKKHIPFTGPPDRGDVIVFHAPVRPPKDFVKRVVALPGETVEIRSGALYINGVGFEESYELGSGFRHYQDSPPVTLKADEFYVLGDNRGSSNDSKDWGPVRLDDIVGKVAFVYWPVSELPFIDELQN